MKNKKKIISVHVREHYSDTDIDTKRVLIENGLVSELFYVEDLERRKLFLNTDIEQATIAGIVRNIMQFNKDDAGLPRNKRRPVFLYIASDGGDVDSGFELIDIIQNSTTPVYTVNLGYQYSMAFLIGLAGHKRYALPSAKFLMHDGSNFVYNSAAKAQDQMKFHRDVEDRIKQYVLSTSKITSDEYDSKQRIEWYMFAEEAKEKGFVDYVVGCDCSIDDII